MWGIGLWGQKVLWITCQRGWLVWNSAPRDSRRHWFFWIALYGKRGFDAIQYEEPFSDAETRLYWRHTHCPSSTEDWHWFCHETSWQRRLSMSKKQSISNSCITSHFIKLPCVDRSFQQEIEIRLPTTLLVVCSNTNGLSQFFRYRDCNIIRLGIKLSVRRLVSFGIVPCWIFGAFPTDIRFYWTKDFGESLAVTPSITMASNATDKASSKASATKASTIIYRYVVLAIAACCIAYIAYWAYNIRLVAILEYGKVIHEFDPYFNYRATEVR